MVRVKKDVVVDKYELSLLKEKGDCLTIKNVKEAKIRPYVSKWAKSNNIKLRVSRTNNPTAFKVIRKE